MSLNIGSNGLNDSEIDIDINPYCKPTIVADAHNLPLRSALNMQCISTHAWEHLDNPRIALDELKRVVKIAHIQVPNFLHPISYYYPILPKHYHSYHKHMYINKQWIYFPKWVMAFLSLFRLMIQKPIFRNLFKPFFDKKTSDKIISF
ncbi:MAG: methyltransferase domain-containing protein [Candidatus Ranarchaeia archaeon]